MDESDEEVFFGEITEAERLAIERIERLKKDGRAADDGSPISSRVIQYTNEDDVFANLQGENLEGGTSLEEGIMSARDQCYPQPSSQSPQTKRSPALNLYELEFPHDSNKDCVNEFMNNLEDNDVEWDIPTYIRKHKIKEKCRELAPKSENMMVEEESEESVSALKNVSNNNCVTELMNNLEDDDVEWDSPTYIRKHKIKEKCRELTPKSENMMKMVEEGKVPVSALTPSSFFDELNPVHSKIPSSLLQVNTDVLVHQPKVIDKNLESESDSILVFSSSSDEECLNNTLDEVDMLMKYGMQYIHSREISKENEENLLPQLVWRQDASDQSKVSGQEEASTEKKLSDNHRIFLMDLKKNLSRKRNPEEPKKIRKYLMLKERLIAKPLQRKKPLSFSRIESPVAAYIKQHPTKLITTAVKVKPSATITSTKPTPVEFVEPRACVQLLPSPQSTNLVNKAVLPMVSYESAPTISCTELRKTPRMQKIMNHTPKILRHAGRAVLSTLPDHAGMKNSEVSVIVDKDVSETDTLSLKF